MRWWLLLSIGLLAGCGTTKWTDTARTATEQLLISDAMDRAVSRLDFRALAGKKVFLDETPVKTMVDSAYLVSTLRQHVLAGGAVLKEKREEAEYIMEVRAGAIGTDNHSVLLGIPATNLPTVTAMPAMPNQIPEIALIKRTEQRAVAKLYLFVYNRESGRPLWQSGAIPEESHAKATWVFGTGPFQQGNIYDGTKFAFDRFDIPLVDLDGSDEHEKHRRVAVADEAFFVEPKDPNRQAKTDAKAADAKTADAKTADAKTADAKTADAKTAAGAKPADGKAPAAATTTPAATPTAAAGATPATAAATPAAVSPATPAAAAAATPTATTAPAAGATAAPSAPAVASTAPNTSAAPAAGVATQPTAQMPTPSPSPSPTAAAPGPAPAEPFAPGDSTPLAPGPANDAEPEIATRRRWVQPDDDRDAPRENPFDRRFRSRDTRDNPWPE